MLTVSYFSNEEYITQAAYTVIAFVSGLAALSILNAFFITHYGLTEGIVLDEEGLPVPVLFFDVEFWALFYTFAQTDEFTCPEPCPNFEFWT
jgi:fucose permease